MRDNQFRKYLMKTGFDLDQIESSVSYVKGFELQL